jgi:alpha/beta superfamily hydrolase
MDEQPVTFTSDDLTLEGLLARPACTAPVRGAVICHPHPLYGGSMYNNVVDAALAATWQLGWATLRFNFRGVGGSEGDHTGGSGEATDVVSAVEFLVKQTGVQPDDAILAGYSFGAMAAMTAAPRLSQLAALTLIALPLQMVDTAALAQFTRPIILAAGDNDNYCPTRQLEAPGRELGPRAQVKLIAGADHFFGGYEEELANPLMPMLRTVTGAG